jgi:ADP-ribose pyrophosphatase YjhB (NUDIX family)
MHDLQQHILKQLILNQSLRYAQLKPAEVEGNLFMYHLKQVTKAGYVEKQPDGSYTLSPAGQDYAERMSLTLMKPRFQPRVVTLIFCQDTAGRYLLYRRKRQPLIGMVGFPYGKVHLGESIQEAAERELLDKTGMTARLIHRGDGYVTIYDGDHPISQILFHLFVGDQLTGKTQTRPLAGVGSIGEAFWARVEDIAPSKLIPSVPDIIREVSIQSEERFFVELSYRLKS